MENQQDLLRTQLNAKDRPNKDSISELFTRDQIKDTPFTIIEIPNEKAFIVWGEYRISPEFQATKFITANEAAQQWYENSTWEIIAIMAAIIAERTINAKIKQDMDWIKEQQSGKTSLAQSSKSSL